MPGTTKWNLTYPSMSDVPAGATQIQTLATSVDGALPQSGTLAARTGIAHHVGLHYYATDTSQLFISDGTVWQEVPMVGVGTADLANGAVTAAKIETQQAYQSLSGPFAQNISYFKDSLANVHLRSSMYTVPSGSVAQGTTLTTFPAGTRPGQSIFGIIWLVRAGSAAPSPSAALMITNLGVMTHFGGPALFSGQAAGDGYVMEIPSWKAES